MGYFSRTKVYKTMRDKVRLSLIGFFQILKHEHKNNFILVTTERESHSQERKGKAE